MPERRITDHGAQCPRERRWVVDRHEESVLAAPHQFPECTLRARDHRNTTRHRSAAIKPNPSPETVASRRPTRRGRSRRAPTISTWPDDRTPRSASAPSAQVPLSGPSRDHQLRPRAAMSASSRRRAGHPRHSGARAVAGRPLGGVGAVWNDRGGRRRGPKSVRVDAVRHDDGGRRTGRCRRTYRSVKRDTQTTRSAARAPTDRRSRPRCAAPRSTQGRSRRIGLCWITTNGRLARRARSPRYTLVG